MARYFPERNPLHKAIKVNAKFLQRFAGAYRINRYAYHDITTVASLFGDVRIEAVNGSKLKSNGVGNGKILCSGG